MHRLTENAFIARGWILLLAAVLICGTAFAQNASVSGTVTDPQGGVIPGSEVTLTNESMQAARTTVTDDTGRYYFQQVAPGNYAIRAELTGFKTFVLRNVALRVDKATRLDLQLELGEVSEIVTVTESTEATLNLVDATIGNNIRGEQIVKLPLESRNVANLLSLQPGAVASGEVAGARRGMSNITLDGVDINEQQNGSTSTQIGPDSGNFGDPIVESKGLAESAFQPVIRVTPDSVQEFRVTVSNPNANQGRSSGAQVTLVTRSGTNQWTGSLYEFHRNTSTTANDFFNNRSGVERPALIRNHYGGSIGGPIKRDRAFFFFNYEGRKDRSQESDVNTVPLAHLGQGQMKFTNTDGVLQTLGPEEIAALYPETGGVNPAATAVLAAASSLPANDDGVGDQVNTGGFRFNGSTPLDWHTYTAKLDFILSDSQTLFVRGNYQWDAEGFLNRFPGAPSPTLWRHPFATAVGHTWTVSPTLVNTFRYGFTRDAFSNQGDSSDNALSFRFVYQPRLYQRTLSRTTPVNNFVNDTSWIKGNHTFQFGTNIRLIRNQRASLDAAFDSGVMNPSFYAESGGVLDQDFVGDGQRDLYRSAITSLLGRYSQYTGRFTFGADGSLLSPGTPTDREFGAEEYDVYFGDTWQVNSQLTLNLGIRWGVNTPVSESSGFQVAPTTPLGDYFNRRVAGAEAGTPLNDPIIIDTAGPFYGKPGFYPMDKNNWQPRISAAWSPSFDDGFLHTLFGNSGESVFRGGFSMSYDRIGSSLAVTFDLNNQLGFVSQSQVSANTFNVTDNTGPLFTGFDQDIRALLPQAELAVPGSLVFPLEQPSDEAQRIERSMDSALTSPVHYNYSFSFGRELPGGLFLEASYIGRRARDLLAERDVFQQNNFVDPTSGMDFYTAALRLAEYRLADAPVDSVAPVAFFENLFPNSVTPSWFQVEGRTATQNAFSLASRDEGFLDWTFYQTLLDDIGTIPNMFFHPQYAALSVFSTLAESDYDALAVTLRERFGESFSAGLNYTWSKSLDWSSGGGGASQTDYASILNSLTPGATRGNSDFDHAHIINTNWLWDLPFGRGQRWGAGSSSAADAVVGGWTLTGVFRWNSGRAHDAPFEASRWATNWNAPSNATRIRDPRVDPSKSGTSPNFWNDRVFAYQSFRDAFAGEVGDRNVFRRQGFVTVNFGLYKSFVMPYAEDHKMTFRWEVYNATNTQRLGDTAVTRTEWGTSEDPQIGQPSATFGNITNIQGTPRVMQFGLRYDF